MKKIFKLTAENKKAERVLDSIKYDIRRYLKRERKKALPKDTTFWDFDCMFGKTEAEATKVNASEVISCFDKASEENWEEAFVKIIAKAITKEKKVEATPSKEEDAEEE